jgi:hypothetical protein
MNDRDGGLTIISRCGQEPTIRLVSERVASWEWISLPRREPRRARERQRGLAPWWPQTNRGKGN